jgi:hypothetical protein
LFNTESWAIRTEKDGSARTEKEGFVMATQQDEFERLMRLPRVGQTVRSRKYGTLWRIINKGEVWQNIPDDPETGEPRTVPAIQLTFWRVTEGVLPGVGKMMGFVYTPYDNTFETNWEVVQ